MPVNRDRSRTGVECFGEALFGRGPLLSMEAFGYVNEVTTAPMCSCSRKMG